MISKNDVTKFRIGALLGEIWEAYIRGFYCIGNVLFLRVVAHEYLV